MKFIPGDIVRLRSGSPSMTVERVRDNKLLCAWFVDGVLHRDDFEVDALILDKKGVQNG